MHKTINNDIKLVAYAQILDTRPQQAASTICSFFDAWVAAPCPF